MISLPDIRDSFLVTGLYRSGTTLLSRLLDCHPDVFVVDQPMLILYTKLKEIFNDLMGIQTIYPFSHQFLEPSVEPNDLSNFADKFVFSETILDSIFDQMHGYAGIWTPEILSLRDRFRSGRFHDLFLQHLAIMHLEMGEPSVERYGVKEIFLEEMIPVLAKHGTRLIAIVRDPRDVVTSDYFNKNKSFNGKHRPILYTLRLWRKSVAYLIRYQGLDELLAVRYEDVVRDPRRWSAAITTHLNLRPFEESDELRLRDMKGGEFTSNSSFERKGGISASSVGRYKKVLPSEVLEYIETVCRPEMQVLGYTPDRQPGNAESIVREFREPSPIEHHAFASDYSYQPDHVSAELERLEYIAGSGAPSSIDQQRRWCIFPVVYETLRAGHRLTLENP